MQSSRKRFGRSGPKMFSGTAFRCVPAPLHHCCYTPFIFTLPLHCVTVGVVGVVAASRSCAPDPAGARDETPVYSSGTKTGSRPSGDGHNRRYPMMTPPSKGAMVGERRPVNISEGSGTPLNVHQHCIRLLHCSPSQHQIDTVT